jgi:hypothetical protein
MNKTEIYLTSFYFKNLKKKRNKCKNQNKKENFATKIAILKAIGFFIHQFQSNLSSQASILAKTSL